jgi:hypothetical protein
LIQNNYYYTEIKIEKTRKEPLCSHNRGFTWNCFHWLRPGFQVADNVTAQE